MRYATLEIKVKRFRIYDTMMFFNASSNISNKIQILDLELYTVVERKTTDESENGC